MQLRIFGSHSNDALTQNIQSFQDVQLDVVLLVSICELNELGRVLVHGRGEELIVISIGGV